MKERTYLAVDLKSFFASVECVERGLDPLTILAPHCPPRCRMPVYPSVGLPPVAPTLIFVHPLQITEYMFVRFANSKIEKSMLQLN